MIEIPVALSGEEVHITKEVPEYWWEHVLTARDAITKASEIANTIDNSVISTSLGLGKDTVAGRQKMAIYFGTTTPSDLADVVPDEIDGINVKIVEEEKPVDTCDGTTSASPLSGGYIVGDERRSGGTTGCPVTHNGNNRMLTAHHMWDCSGVDGEDVFQLDRKVGTIDEYNSKLDYAIFNDVYDDNGFSPTIHLDGEYIEVNGRIYNPEYYMEEGEDIFKSGRNTGQEVGKIDRVNDSFSGASCDTSYDEEAIRVDSIQANGDSGSAAFIKEEYFDEDYAYILCLCNHGFNQIEDGSCGFRTFNQFEKTGGVSAGTLYEEESLQFGY